MSSNKGEIMKHACNIHSCQRLIDDIDVCDATLKSIKYGIIITNPAIPGNPVFYVNPAYTRITGFLSEEVLGKPPLSFIGEETDVQSYDILKNALKNSESISIELINYTKEKKKYWNELTIDPVFDDQEKLIYYVGMINDITKRKELEFEAARKDNVLEAVSKVSHELLKSQDIDKSIFDALAILGEHMDMDRVYVFQNHLGDDGDMLISQKYEWVKDEAMSQFGNPDLQNLSYNILGYERWYEELSNGREISGLIDDFPEKEKRVLKEQLIVSLLVVPIFSNNEFWGFIGFDDIFQERTWSVAEKDVLMSAASNIGGAINQHRIDRELKIAIENSRKASEYKTMFLSKMSHEIRTPLNSIIGVADILMDSDLNEEQSKYMELLRKAGNNLLSLVNDILDLSKIESGHMKLKREKFKIASVLEDVMSVAGVSLGEKNVSLNYYVDEDVPCGIIGDADKLRQILLNLIGNSIKFTEVGWIKVEVSLLEKKMENIRLKFKVSDSGAGIPKENIKLIFNSFIQSDSQFTKKHNGTGLGLTITKELVELMNGEIYVQSKLGYGSSFIFEIEVNVGDCTFKTENLKVAQAQEERRYNILLVDDSDDNRMLIHAFLKNKNYNIDDAENGEIAVRKAKEKEYDIILMDMQMPVMDGFEATMAIREYEKSQAGKRAAIIALTAYAFKEILDRTIESGCDYYIVKPVRKEKLLECLDDMKDGGI